MTPFGDSCSASERRCRKPSTVAGPVSTTLLIRRRSEHHVRRNWYLLAGIEVPITDPQPYDFQPTAGLMKEFERASKRVRSLTKWTPCRPWRQSRAGSRLRQ
jgi:hypothetical protein